MIRGMLTSAISTSQGTEEFGRDNECSSYRMLIRIRKFWRPGPETIKTKSRYVKICCLVQNYSNPLSMSFIALHLSFNDLTLSFLLKAGSHLANSAKLANRRAAIPHFRLIRLFRRCIPIRKKNFAHFAKYT